MDDRSRFPYGTAAGDSKAPDEPVARGQASLAALLWKPCHEHDPAPRTTCMPRRECVPVARDVLLEPWDTMDVIVRTGPEDRTWSLTDLLGRAMGVVVEDTPHTFVVRPAGHAVETMRGMRTGPFGSLDQALAAIETHTRGVCRRHDVPNAGDGTSTPDASSSQDGPNLHDATTGDSHGQG